MSEAVGHVLSEKQSVNELMNLAEDALESTLLAGLPHLKDVNPDAYKKAITEREVTQILVASFAGGAAIAKGIGIRLALSPSGTLKPQASVITATPDAPILTAGHNETLLRDWPFIQSRFQTMSATDLARYLVQLEIDANPTEVSSPVDVIGIRPSGVVFAQTKSGCPLSIPP
jgi:hypothetical protein